MSLFATEIQAHYAIVYDLFPFGERLVLPTAYVVSQGKDGHLAHIKKKALPETIKGYGLTADGPHQRLFQLVAALQPSALATRFNPSKRKAPPALERLLEDKDRAKAIFKYADKLLDEFLQLAEEHRLHLTWAVDRKVLVQDFLLSYSETPLSPLLYFRKEKQGVRYWLRLRQEEQVLAVHEHDTTPLTNHPAWCVIDYTLHSIAHINGNMLRPFLKRPVLEIPARSVRTYFETFILKQARKVDIEAEGFEVVQDRILQNVLLRPLVDLFTGSWVLSVQMVYASGTFAWSNKKTKKTQLEFSENGEIVIQQAVRDQEQEQEKLSLLKNLGLEVGQGSYLQVRQTEDNDFALLEWLGRREEELLRAGFRLDPATVDDKTVSLATPALQVQTATGNDWFDLYGQVTVGEHTFPFLKLARHIKEGNRLYPLPDGHLFLIPAEWMARYKGLFLLGMREGTKLRLAKSQQPLLVAAGLADGDGQSSQEAAKFEPSPLLKAQLRPYQTDGAAWLVGLYQRGLGACLADDMGLGKTLQTIAALLHAKDGRELVSSPAAAQQGNLFAPAEDMATLQPLQALIVLPASLVFNWAAELDKFAPSLHVYRHTGPKRHKDVRLLSRFDVLLTTYQTALRDVELLKQLQLEYVVLDESQYIKNKDSKIFKAINQLQTAHKISLSGTPIENSLADLWAQMQFINPGLLGSFRFFQQTFIRPIEKEQDEAQKAQLRQLVAPYLLRRTKGEVAKDLPELTTQVFLSEMTPDQKKRYEKEKSAARNYLLEQYQPDNPQYRFRVLQSLTKLRQIANHPVMALEDYQQGSGKFNDVMAQWEVLRKGGHKVLAFSSFVKHLRLYRHAFEAAQQPFAWLTGEQSSKEREQAVRQFSERPEVQAFLISIKAGGAGLNLTAASYVFLLDPWWNPAIEQQAIARAHRIGQQQQVFALKFISKGTIEEKILQLQERKAQLATDIIGRAERLDFSPTDIEYLLD